MQVALAQKPWLNSHLLQLYRARRCMQARKALFVEPLRKVYRQPFEAIGSF